MMKEMLQVILDMDKNARERVAQAEKYREREINALSEKKTLITAEENQKALDFAHKRSQKQRSEGEAYLRGVSERNRKISEGIDKAFEDNEEKWIDTIVKNVTTN